MLSIVKTSQFWYVCPVSRTLYCTPHECHNQKKDYNMIQRIQSILLLLTSITFFLQFVFNFATSNVPIAQYMDDKVFDVNDHPVLIALAALGGVIALVNIFLFRNRPLQIRLGYLLIILCIFLPVVAGMLFFTSGNPMESDQEINESAGLLLPLVGLITTIFANRYINKDNKLVKSMDRLR